MISVVNYGSGNLAAISNLLRLSNLPFEIIDDPAGLALAEHILLPGVGAFDNTMRSFRESGFESALKRRTAEGAALLGICVGMQVLADSSEEGELPGLGFISGEVRRFDSSVIRCGSKVPHMGWNSIEPRGQYPLLRDIDVAKGFYFLHSYYFESAASENALATTEHGLVFHSVVGKGRVFGVQFHPEKSHANGVQLFKNFMEI
jgi:glutamine amidotransferase